MLALNIGLGSGESQEVLLSMKGDFPRKGMGAEVAGVGSRGELVVKKMILSNGVSPVETCRKAIFPDHFRAVVLVARIDSPRSLFLESVEEVACGWLLTGCGKEGGLAKRIAAQPVEIAL